MSKYIALDDGAPMFDGEAYDKRTLEDKLADAIKEGDLRNVQDLTIQIVEDTTFTLEVTLDIAGRY